MEGLWQRSHIFSSAAGQGLGDEPMRVLYATRGGCSEPSHGQQISRLLALHAVRPSRQVW